MDFKLDKVHQLAQKMFREFAENEVKPLAQEIDEEERYPIETIQKMGKLGMMGIPFPKKYGGAGGDSLAYAMAIEELSKYCMTTATAMAAHTSLCLWPIYQFGTEEQKMKYMPKMCSGEWIGAFGLTEAGAGSDAQGQQTTAVLDEKGENWILNGSKIFITNASYAYVFFVVAVTGVVLDKKGRPKKEISTFIVEKGDPGFSIGKHEKKMGIKGSATCELIFEDCVIPLDRMVGKRGEGFHIAMQTVDGGRVGVGAEGVGVSQSAINETVKYTKERMQFGKRISQFQNTQFELADMQTRVDAGRLLLYRAAMAKDEHDPEMGYYSSMCKYYSGMLASDTTRRCLQLFGGYGYTREYPLERMMRDAKILEIYEGTAEVQKMVISGHMGIK